MNNDELAQKMHEAFGDDGLVRSESQVVAALDIPEVSKEFLVTLGLPAAEVMGYSFRPSRTLLPVSDASTQVRCLAENFNLVMAMDCTASGSVWLIDLDERMQTMFVNSGVELLGCFLSELVLHWRRRAAGEDFARSAAEARRLMLAADREALDEKVGYWPTVLAELEIGLL